MTRKNLKDAHLENLRCAVEANPKALTRVRRRRLSRIVGKYLRDRWDPLAEKAATVDFIRDRETGEGTVWVWCWSRDCDGVEGAHVKEIPASWYALNRELRMAHEYAEGPYRVEPIHAREAAGFKPEYWYRDRVLEAFENGHPHRI